MTNIKYIVIKNNKSNLEKLYSLRQSFYKKTQNYPEQELWHAYDESAIHVVAEDENQNYLAAVTMVTGQIIPVETFLNIDYFKQKKSLTEIKKFVVDHTSLLNKKEIAINLICKMCEELIHQDVDRIVIAVSERMKRNLTLYKNVGFEILGSYYHPLFGYTTVESLQMKDNHQSVFSQEKLVELLKQRLIEIPVESSVKVDVLNDSIWQLSFRYLDEEDFAQKKEDIIPPFKSTDYDPIVVEKRRKWLKQKLGTELYHVGNYSVDEQETMGNIENLIGFSQIPIGLAGPLKINGQYAKGEFYVPMATTEGALLLSYNMGMRLLSHCEPIRTEVLTNKIHISPFFVVNYEEEQKLKTFIQTHREKIILCAEATSHHLKFLDIETTLIGNRFVCKFIYQTGDAHGLNMINQATHAACEYISKATGIRFYLRSHYSGVKHYSSLNQHTGYGRKVRASIIVPEKILTRLSVTAQDLNHFFNSCIKIGHVAGIPAVNVHAANAVAAIFAACGQDLADMSSSGSCSSYAELANEGRDLLLQITLYTLLVGTVGGGTGLGTQKECLNLMDCYGTGKANKFSEIIAASVLAGELVTSAAVVNGTYVEAHNKYGRNKPKQ